MPDRDIAHVDVLAPQCDRVEKKTAFGEVLPGQHDNALVLQHVEIDAEAK